MTYRIVNQDGTTVCGENKRRAIQQAKRTGAVRVEHFCLPIVLWQNPQPGTISRRESTRQSVERIRETLATTTDGEPLSGRFADEGE
jgi:hypothetical protein